MFQTVASMTLITCLSCSIIAETVVKSSVTPAVTTRCHLLLQQNPLECVMHVILRCWNDTTLPLLETVVKICFSNSQMLMDS